MARHDYENTAKWAWAVVVEQPKHSGQGTLVHFCEYLPQARVCARQWIKRNAVKAQQFPAEAERFGVLDRNMGTVEWMVGTPTP